MAARASSISASPPDSVSPPPHMPSRDSCESLPSTSRQRRSCSGLIGVVMVGSPGPAARGFALGASCFALNMNDQARSVSRRTRSRKRRESQVVEVKRVQVLERLFFLLRQRLLDDLACLVAVQPP